MGPKPRIRFPSSCGGDTPHEKTTAEEVSFFRRVYNKEIIYFFFLAGAFFLAAFLAGAFFLAAFLAGAFFFAAFLAGAFLAGAFFLAAFLAGAFFLAVANSLTSFRVFFETTSFSHHSKV